VMLRAGAAVDFANYWNDQLHKHDSSTLLFPLLYLTSNNSNSNRTLCKSEYDLQLCPRKRVGGIQRERHSKIANNEDFRAFLLVVLFEFNE